MRRNELGAAVKTRWMLVRDALRQYGPTVAGYALPFVLVLYLALRGGGYETIVRSQVGIAVWWLVLLGAAVGILPVSRVGRLAWAMLGVVLAFAIWTGLGIAWSDSSERSVTEFARVATYIGVFALALNAQGRDGLRRSVYAVGSAIAVVGVMALMSRLHPAWFPENETAQVLPIVRARVSYPLNYWNGLATLIAIGIPMLLWMAISARRILTRALAARDHPSPLPDVVLHALARWCARARGEPRSVLDALPTTICRAAKHRSDWDRQPSADRAPRPSVRTSPTTSPRRRRRARPTR